MHVCLFVKPGNADRSSGKVQYTCSEIWYDNGVPSFAWSTPMSIPAQDEGVYDLVSAAPSLNDPEKFHLIFSNKATAGTYQFTHLLCDISVSPICPDGIADKSINGSRVAPSIIVRTENNIENYYIFYRNFSDNNEKIEYANKVDLSTETALKDSNGDTKKTILRNASIEFNGKIYVAYKKEDKNDIAISSIAVSDFIGSDMGNKKWTHNEYIYHGIAAPVFFKFENSLYMLYPTVDKKLYYQKIAP